MNPPQKKNLQIQESNKKTQLRKTQWARILQKVTPQQKIQPRKTQWVKIQPNHRLKAKTQPKRQLKVTPQQKIQWVRKLDKKALKLKALAKATPRPLSV